MFDEEGFEAPLSIGLDGGEGTLAAFEMTEDNQGTATIEGEMLRLADYMGDPKVAEGATPQPHHDLFICDPTASRRVRSALGSKPPLAAVSMKVRNGP